MVSHSTPRAPSLRLTPVPYESFEPPQRAQCVSPRLVRTHLYADLSRVDEVQDVAHVACLHLRKADAVGVGGLAQDRADERAA